VPVNGHKSTYHDVSRLGNEDQHAGPENVKTVTVVNPGNFSNDRSFVVIYPLKGEV